LNCSSFVSKVHTDKIKNNHKQPPSTPQTSILSKTPPTESGIKRLAIQTEDHALEYANFEGEIPQGQYGAGTVTIWDRGGLVVEDFRENKKILFELSGNKMQGRYALIKTKFGGQKENKNWLFFKRK
jgi:DNA ligase D-like protein (predicted 3'-phosphoesterase)